MVGITSALGSMSPIARLLMMFYSVLAALIPYPLSLPLFVTWSSIGFSA
jgi:hypothetical protein